MMYVIKRDSKYLARKTHNAIIDCIGLLWTDDIQSARRYRTYEAAMKQALRINGSTSIRRVDGLKEVG